MPSGNSVGLLNLVRLARLTGNIDFEEKAMRLTRAFSSEIATTPSLNTMFLVALDFLIGPSLEIVVAGDLESKETKNMLNVLREGFVPNKVVLLKPTNDLDIVQLTEFAKGMKMIDKKTTAYVCKNFECSLPTTNKDRLRTLLKDE